MSENSEKVILLYDGMLSSAEIAGILGLSARYVRRIATKYNLPRLHCGAQNGEKNHQFVSGRRIDPDGYVLVTAPKNHPQARQRSNRQIKLIFEHRLVMEGKLGRYLTADEVVDHIDEITLHNDPDNLRIFPKNGDHLRETIQGKGKMISESGRRNLSIKHLRPLNFSPVDTYGLRRKRGDARLLQILRAALKLGINSPYLLGTRYWLEKAGISDFSHSSLTRALDELYRRYEQDLVL